MPTPLHEFGNDDFDSRVVALPPNGTSPCERSEMTRFDIIAFVFSESILKTNNAQKQVKSTKFEKQKSSYQLVNCTTELHSR